MLRYDLPRVAKASLVLVDCGAVFFGSTLLKEFLDKRTLIANTEVTYSGFHYISDSHVQTLDYRIIKIFIFFLLRFIYFSIIIYYQINKKYFNIFFVLI